MPLRVALHHETSYSYSRPVTLLPQTVRLRPAPHCRTPVLSYSLRVTPEDQFCNWSQDPHGNWQARYVFPKPATAMKVEVDLVIEWTVINPFDFFVEPSAEKWPFGYLPEQRKELAAFTQPGPLTPRLSACIDRMRTLTGKTVDVLVEINRLLSTEISYIVRLEPGVQVPEETLTKGSGSCRDTGWLLVEILRHLGLAARFVSGYLIQLVPDQESLDGPSGAKSDFTDLHAWCEVFIPGAGWIGLDPTSGLLAGEGHLPLACTPAPSSAAPVSGALDYVVDPEHELKTEFGFAMTITRIDETPRVTKPYSEAQATAMDAFGRQLDLELQKLDLRLTTGGEPTFVSIDDPDGEEWNTAALGPHKRERALELLQRLRGRFAPKGLLHLGQGKWYPGEPLPRWAFSCYWRSDGHPIWRHDALYADERAPAGHGPGQAATFAHELCQRLDLPSDVAVPAHEDVWYHLWAERRLPPGTDPLKADLKDPLERQRLARLLDQGLDRVAGYAIPLQRNGSRWDSARWLEDLLMRRQLFLLPGDSPMGYRLPLDSLPVAPDTGAALDPYAPRPPLLQFSDGRERQGRTPPFVGGVVRTALCVEPRGGVLRIFMPPCYTVDDYLDLVAAIEDTALATGLPVVLEGYTPPRDPRLAQFQITPDPGVIEVNIQPTSTWNELSALTDIVYEEARQSRLTTEKFMVDGRHIGTGGGNHITLGGATPADSPFLRRPDLLRSLVGYWHNHPSLSYLFSGLFIGPTSQAPRADEARTETIYELDLALSRIPDYAVAPPWFIDRSLRNLLVDLTGNTHRAEFCIDKLYSPDSASGRLGIVELRNFEMPPHARMSLAAHALLRSLLARFWKEPYHERLARWGSQLHDRFLLPHFVGDDFQEVLDDQRAHGYDLDPAWYTAQQEFRFPVLGRSSYRGIDLELRLALEPWNVLGEENVGGTVRFVDASVERIQVGITGLPPDRYRLAVNGVAVPLRPTGRADQQIAGVRYRAWQPASCLHPLIPVHAPLVFDLVDTWNGRAVAGCTYHVAHPGGRNYLTRPINAYEAEGRRLARFAPVGHTPGPFRLAEPIIDPETPFTLDLRKW
jgi:uncharacterized protein (DUF2126 family)/transglutaminase-like putative cysteine protease